MHPRSLLFAILLMMGSGWPMSAQPLSPADWPQLEQLARQQQRHTLVFLYTDWCRYCRAMEQRIFTQPTLKTLLSERIFFLPFNAEYPEAVAFGGKTWYFVPRGSGMGTHELALALTASLPAPGYPVLLLLNPALEVVWLHQGFLPAAALEKVLQQALEPR